MKNTTLISSLICFSATLFIQLPAHATKIYQWQDENGRMHYSQRPPRGKEKQVEQVKLKAPKRIDGAGYQAASQEQPKEKESEAQKKATQLAEARKNCDDARKIIAQMQNSPANTIFNLPNGESKMLSKEERAARIDQAKLSADFYCKNP